MSAGPIVALAPSAAQGAVKVLSTDIVKLEHRFYRRIRVRVPTGKLTKKGKTQYRREERLEPINVALNVNPIGLGILGILGAAAGFVLFGRVRTGIPTIGEVEIYKGPFADEFDTWKVRRQAEACQKLFDEWNVTSDINRLRAIWDESTVKGCTWHALVPRP